MAKKGMKRPNITHKKQKNHQSNVPEIQGKAKLSNAKANPIIAGSTPPSQKVYHTTPYSKENAIHNIYPEIDNDLARDNIENDMTYADLQDFSSENPLV